MGSKTFDGVRFSAYPEDHLPPHVHGAFAEVRVIIELSDRKVRLARCKDRILPRNAKRSDVNHVLQTARKYAPELLEIWRIARG